MAAQSDAARIQAELASIEAERRAIAERKARRLAEIEAGRKEAAQREALAAERARARVDALTATRTPAIYSTGQGKNVSEEARLRTEAEMLKTEEDDRLVSAPTQQRPSCAWADQHIALSHPQTPRSPPIPPCSTPSLPLLQTRIEAMEAEVKAIEKRIAVQTGQYNDVLASISQVKATFASREVRCVALTIRWAAGLLGGVGALARCMHACLRAAAAVAADRP